MATEFAVVLPGDDEEHLEAVAEAILDEVARIERLLSRFDPAGEIARINRQAAERTVRIDVELAAILETCRQAWLATGGAFDVVRARLASADAPHGWDEVDLDPIARQVRFRTPDVYLDLGGYGKGYALGCGARLLEQYRVRDALLSGGGSSLLTRGSDAGRPWRIGVRSLLTDDEVTQIELSDAALSTSATLAPSETVSDTIDPARQQALQRRSSCTVITADPAQAEILSTALLVMGRTDAWRFLESGPAAFIADVRRVLWIESDGAQETLAWYDREIPSPEPFS